MMALRRVHELGKGLPVPRDAFLEHIEGDRFDIDEIAHRNLTVCWATRRDADPTVAHHHTGHAMPRGWRERGIPEDLRIVVRVRIDEAWRDDAVGCVDRLLRPTGDLSDLDDFSLGHSNVCPARR